MITTQLGNPPDLKVREIILYVGQNQIRKGWVLYCSCLVNEERIANEVIQPLSTLSHVHTANDGLEIFHRVQNVITSVQIEEVHDLDEQVSSILQGYVLLYIQFELCRRIHLKKRENRSINELENEKASREPKDGFIENLSSNIALIRHRLPYPDLRIEEYKLGTKSHTKVSLIFVEHLVKMVPFSNY